VTEYMEWSKTDSYKDTEKSVIDTIEECKAWKTWQSSMYLKDGTIIWRFGMHTLNDKKKSIMLGYWLATKYRGNGYITECVEWVKQYWFTEMWLDKITLRCMEENLWSRKVAERSWFTLDGIIRHDEFQKGKYIDNCYYSFLKEEY
jgi:ribosomal-protein-serine acetyltransferase